MGFLGRDVRGVSPAVGTLVLTSTVILEATAVGIFAFGLNLADTAETAEDILDGEQPTEQNNGGEETSNDGEQSETTSSTSTTGEKPTRCPPEDAATTAKNKARC